MLKRHLLWTGLALFLLAGGLRFTRLDRWSFGPDEIGSFWEVEIFRGQRVAEKNSPNAHVPAMIPVAMLVQSAGHDLFGKDEFGSRAIHALAGSLHIVVVFFLLAMLLSYPAALMTAVLLMLAPAHLFHSQYHRFYMLGLLFVSCCQLLGALALEKRSLFCTILACVFVFLSMLTHTLLVGVLAGLLGGLLVGSWTQERPLPKRIFLTLLVAALGVVLLVMLYLKPLISSKAAMDKGWIPYGLFQSIGASVIQVGWPTLLLAMVGIPLLWHRHRTQASYWTIQSLMWGGCSLVLPFVIPYHPEYVFPMMLGIFVLAGYATGAILEWLWHQHRTAGLAWIVVVGLLSLPDLVSYYQDGNRHDYRAVAEHLRENIQEGDRIASYSPYLIVSYAKDLPLPARLHPTDVMEELKRLTTKKNRLWIVLPTGREGLSLELRRWLTRNCALEWRTARRRFDYYSFVLEVYLFSPD